MIFTIISKYVFINQIVDQTPSLILLNFLAYHFLTYLDHHNHHVMRNFLIFISCFFYREKTIACFLLCLYQDCILHLKLLISHLVHSNHWTHKQMKTHNQCMHRRSGYDVALTYCKQLHINSRSTLLAGTSQFRFHMSMFIPLSQVVISCS